MDRGKLGVALIVGVLLVNVVGGSVAALLGLATLVEMLAQST
jgi:hypothetical protein